MKKVSAKIVISALFILALFSLSFAQNEERITITTYYPSPVGSYNELATNKFAVDVNGVAVPTEYAAMQNGDAHIGRSLIVGAGGGSGYAYDEGVILADGDALFKGNVSIGVPPPFTSVLPTRVRISGATADNTAASIVVEDSQGNATFIVRNDGRVGINTMGRPIEGRLEIRTDPIVAFQDRGAIYLTNSAASTTNDGWSLYGAGGSNFEIAHWLGDNRGRGLTMISQDLTNDISVGIGTVAPSGKLDVRIAGNNGAPNFIVDDVTGHVGIGITDPAAQLTVVGPFGDNIDALDVAVGDNSVLEVKGTGQVCINCPPNVTSVNEKLIVVGDTTMYGNTIIQGKLDPTASLVSTGAWVGPPPGMMDNSTCPANTFMCGVEVNAGGALGFSSIRAICCD